jgi:hypothetical protein
MTWLRLIIRTLLGHTRYHDQANEVNIRRLRTELLSKQLEVVRRGK